MILYVHFYVKRTLEKWDSCVHAFYVKQDGELMYSEGQDWADNVWSGKMKITGDSAPSACYLYWKCTF